MQTKLTHMQLNVKTENMPFYVDLMATMGWRVLYQADELLGVADSNGTSLWFAGEAKPVSNDYDGTGLNHLAFGVDSQADVDAAAAYITGRDINLLFETPRHRPEFSGEDSTYYQIMFETPDRILIEIVYTGPKSA